MQAISTQPSLSGFVWVAPESLANPIRIDWERTEELYRNVYEMARAAAERPMTNRLTLYWN